MPTDATPLVKAEKHAHFVLPFMAKKEAPKEVAPEVPAHRFMVSCQGKLWLPCIYVLRCRFGVESDFFRARQ